MRVRSRRTGNLNRGAILRGAILLGVLIVLLTISMIGATLASLFFSVTTVAEVELARAQAIYLAEAGIAHTVFQLRQAGATGAGAAQKVSASLGPGEYEVKHDVTTQQITSTGKVRGVRRSVQIRYVPF